MSYTEIRQEGGMPFGGMPYDSLLHKLEETDLDRGDGNFTTMEDRYDAYARSEIIDWTPDDTYLESDHSRRDPALSRSILNLRHSGGRGPNDHRHPQHPELFLGFTGNDPRGADTQPRLDMARAQMAVRAREREVRMGHNVGHGDFIEADRPWSGPAFVYDQKEIQRRQKEHFRWFPAQKEGRPWGRNVVADEHYGLRQRRDIVSDESLYTPEQGSSPAWPHQSSYDPAWGVETGKIRRVDGPAGSDKAPWRNTIGGANFVVQHYTGTAGGGRAAYGSGAIGGARLGVVQVDHRSNAHNEDARVANRRILAESLGAAAIHRRARARVSEGDTAHSSSAVGRRPGQSAPKLARDIAAAALLTLQDLVTQPLGHGDGYDLRSGLGAPPGDRQSALYRVQPSHEGTANARLANTGSAVQSLREATAAERRGVLQAARPSHAGPANIRLADDTGVAVRGLREDVAADRQGALYLAQSAHTEPANANLANTEAAIRGLRDANDRQRAPHSTHPSHAGPANARLANVGAMIRGLRGGASADFRMVQGQVVLAGPEPASIEMGGGGLPGGGLTPSNDYISATHASEMPLARAAASADLEIHCYGQRAHANLWHPMDTVATAQRGGFSTPQAMMGRREGRSKAPQFRSHTQDSTVLGGHPDEFFGSVGEHAGPHTGGLSIGDKSVRATALADKGDDTISVREDFDAGLSETY